MAEAKIVVMPVCDQHLFCGLQWYANDFGQTTVERLQWILPFLKVGRQNDTILMWESLKFEESYFSYFITEILNRRERRRMTLLLCWVMEVAIYTLCTRSMTGV